MGEERWEMGDGRWMGEDGRSRGIYCSGGEVEKVYFLAVNMDANLVTWAFSEVFAWAFSGTLS